MSRIRTDMVTVDSLKSCWLLGVKEVDYYQAEKLPSPFRRHLQLPPILDRPRSDSEAKAPGCRSKKWSTTHWCFQSLGFPHHLIMFAACTVFDPTSWHGALVLMVCFFLDVCSPILETTRKWKLQHLWGMSRICYWLTKILQSVISYILWCKYIYVCAFKGQRHSLYQSVDTFHHRPCLIDLVLTLRRKSPAPDVGVKS